MGLLDRFRKSGDSFVGVSQHELGDDFEEVAAALHDTLLGQAFLVEEMGGMVVCRSPVLVLRGGVVEQPASVVPASMLARFWSGEGREVLEGTELAPTVARLARHFAASAELSRAALGEVHELYVSDDAPTARWPVQDRRLRLASLVLTDLVRRLAAGFADREVFASYGLSRSTDHDEVARERYAAMCAQEQAWIQSALARS